MRIQYVSDIHLEFSSKIPKILPRADVLCLLGDIGYPYSKIYKQFLVEMSKMFKKVFLIAGNHEYYNLGPNKGKTINEIEEYIEYIITSNKLNNITYLNDTYEDYEGYRFIGSVLWSNITNPNYLVNDFEQIIDMTVPLYNELHKISKEEIEEAMKSTELPIIILTHHMPSYDLIDDKYKTVGMDKFNQCFASDCSNFFKSQVKLWLYGHTHKPKVVIINGIKFGCNPRGYPDENNPINIINLVEIYNLLLTTFISITNLITIVCGYKFKTINSLIRVAFYVKFF